MVKKQSNKGGSLASDAVEGLIDPEVWSALDKRFTNELLGGGSIRVGGGGVKTSLPFGANPYSPLNKHAAEAKTLAAAKNISTFPPVPKSRYGRPAGGSSKKPGKKTQK